MPVETSRVSCRPKLLLPSEPSRSRSARYPRKSRLLSVTWNRVFCRSCASPSPASRCSRSASEIGRRRDVALLGQLADQLLDQLLDLRGGVSVRRVAHQPRDGLRREQPAVEQRVEDRVVQRLHGLGLLVAGMRVIEPARQQQVRELREQILEVDALELVAGELRVSVLHGPSRLPRVQASRGVSCRISSFPRPGCVVRRTPARGAADDGCPPAPRTSTPRCA